jgi:uncharacterized membrane protein
MKRFILRPASLLIAILLMVCFADSVLACPTCKEGVIGQQKNMATGYFWSILLMIAMPFTLLSFLGSYFYFEIRRARKLQDTTKLSHQDAPSDPSRITA